MFPIYLASSSPRRRELLSLLAHPFESLCISVVESRQSGEPPQEYVIRLAREKALAGVAVARQGYPVLGADTVVVLQDTVLEKPCDQQQAIDMLQQLSGRWHQVMTGIAFADRQRWLSRCVVTEVYFRRLSQEEIEHYVASGEPMDKAGAYGIQGTGGRFVRSIRGSYYSVVGLPLVETLTLLTTFTALRQTLEEAWQQSYW